MQRSGWKLPFLSSIFLSNLFFKSTNFVTKQRNSIIAPHFLNKKLIIYSGLVWKNFMIRKPMIGKKLGEFCITKVFGSAIATSMALKQQRKKEDKKNKKK